MKTRRKLSALEFAERQNARNKTIENKEGAAWHRAADELPPLGGYVDNCFGEPRLVSHFVVALSQSRAPLPFVAYYDYTACTWRTCRRTSRWLRWWPMRVWVFPRFNPPASVVLWSHLPDTPVTRKAIDGIYDSHK
jgi:hypothetical protein